jgi:hypothetical protein
MALRKGLEAALARHRDKQCIGSFVGQHVRWLSYKEVAQTASLLSSIISCLLPVPHDGARRAVVALVRKAVLLFF